MDVIVGMFKLYEDYLVAVALCLPRIYAFIATAQVLTPGSVPRLARNAAILIIAIPVIPVTYATVGDVERTLNSYAYFFAKEFVIGFLFGYMIGWIFWAVAAAGDLIDNQRGAAIAASIDPLQGHETSPLGNLFSQAFLTYFFSIGGFLVILDILYTSYVMWPITKAVPIIAPDFPELVLGILDFGMRTMFIIAAPVVAIMFLAEFALALVSRFAPQIQVFILAMPIKSGIAILILIFYSSILFPYAADRQSYFHVYTDQLYELLEGGETLLDQQDAEERDTGDQAR
ncbi:MAG: type III secretion system export apparatus subunit SctT [Pseudomonadota bacterium]